jgi:hypothetical protein
LVGRAQVCINGGLVTQVEQAEMPQIVRAARLDAQQSGIRCAIEPIRKLSFAAFCDAYDKGVATTQVVQHKKERERASHELEQLRAAHDAERKGLVQAREDALREKREIEQECETLKTQLSTRDGELAQLKHVASGGRAGGVDSYGQEPAMAMNNNGQLQAAASSAAVESGSGDREPGYMELLGWTVNKSRSAVGGGDRLALPRQSDELWHRIHNHHANTVASRNPGELLQDSELMFQYVSTGGPADNRDWYRTSHENLITRHVEALREEAREVKEENAACMERIGELLDLLAVSEAERADLVFQLDRTQKSPFFWCRAGVPAKLTQSQQRDQQLLGGSGGASRAIGRVLNNPDKEMEVKLRFSDGTESSHFIDIFSLERPSSEETAAFEIEWVEGPRLWCKEGAIARSGERLGKLLSDPGHDGRVKLRWADGSLSPYVRIAKLHRPTDEEAARFDSLHKLAGSN